MRATVVASDALTDDGSIRRLDLVPIDADLPAHVPGSHLLVGCGTDEAGHARWNAYSLTGECGSPTTYSVSVLNSGSAGGSAWLHRRRVGDVLDIKTPRSTFAPVLSARRHLLIAGGIGVTPILSLARWAGDSADALYLHRAGRGAHAGDLESCCAATVLTDRAEFVGELRTALRRQPLGTHLYVCGPAALIALVLAEARSAGWPESRCHVEAFAASAPPPRPFRLRLRRSGTVVDVPASRSALDVLDDLNVAVDSQCRHGVCGRCRTRVTAGEVEHRDLVHTDRDHMMVCVSRAVGTSLVEVDL